MDEIRDIVIGLFRLAGIEEDDDLITVCVSDIRSGDGAYLQLMCMSSVAASSILQISSYLTTYLQPTQKIFANIERNNDHQNFPSSFPHL